MDACEIPSSFFSTGSCQKRMGPATKDVDCTVWSDESLRSAECQYTFLTLCTSMRSRITFESPENHSSTLNRPLVVSVSPSLPDTKCVFMDDLFSLDISSRLIRLFWKSVARLVDSTVVVRDVQASVELKQDQQTVNIYTGEINTYSAPPQEARHAGEVQV